MKIKLGVIATKHLQPGLPSRPRHHHHVDLKLDLTEAEYALYKEATEGLHSVRANADLFKLVQWNYQAYFSTLDAYLEARKAGTSDFFDGRPPYLEINRQALNFLSSVRTYLDHHETSISRRHGRNSENLKRFHKYCSDAYDSSFSYRFLYKLRNYAQHCGLPISHIEFSDALSEEDPPKRVHSLAVGISRDHVLRDFDWEGLTAGVAAQSPIIDVNRHISRLMRDLDTINQRVLEDELPFLRDSARVIIELVNRIEFDEGQPCVFELDRDIVDPSKPDRLSISRLRFSPVPVSLAEAVLKSGYEGLSDALPDSLAEYVDG